MKKMNLKQLVPLILGTLLFLLGLALLPNGGWEAIVLGIITLLIGLCYVLAILLAPFIKKDNFPLVASVLFITGFPLYLLVQDIMTIIDGYQGFELIGWIIIVIKVLAEIGVITFSILIIFKKDSTFGKIKQISVLVLLCMLIVEVIFSYRGVPKTINGTTLLEYAFIVCYGYIALNSLNESNVKQENTSNVEEPKEETEEKQEETSKDEKPIEETKE